MTIVIDPQLAPPSGITLDDIVGRIRHELADTDNINELEEDINDTVEIFTFKYPLSSVTRGSTISIDDETMHVWSANTENREVRVRRGYNSLATQHAANSLCSIDGKNTKQIIDAINDELMSLWSLGLYQMRSIAVPGFVYAKTTYAPAELEGNEVYDVQYLEISQDLEWNHLPGWRQSALDGSITLPYYVPSSNLRVLYKVPYSRLTDGGDDIQTAAGLHAEAVDILVWGAVLRLTASEELKRNQFRSQGDTRRPDEVPYRAVSLARNDIRQTRDERITQEKDRLRKRFPNRIPGW